MGCWKEDYKNGDEVERTAINRPSRLTFVGDSNLSHSRLNVLLVRFGWILSRFRCLLPLLLRQHAYVNIHLIKQHKYTCNGALNSRLFAMTSALTEHENFNKLSIIASRSIRI